MGARFKPSQVVMTWMPLTGTMTRRVNEFAAAILVHVCEARGDEWQPVTLTQMLEVLSSDAQSGREPFAKLLRNPFFTPDFAGLVDQGFAKWAEANGSPALALTDQGFGALSTWTLSDACARCRAVRHADESKVTWRCTVCKKFVCRDCTLKIPGRVPAEYYWATLCSRECWEVAGSPSE
jgi:hypothetical protein